MNITRFSLSILVALWSFGMLTPSLADDDILGIAQSLLPNKIIRSLAVHPTESKRILVGLKGEGPGDGLILESQDAGVTWTTMNGGQAPNVKTSDVQAVAYGPEGIILAGTWKNGLFWSNDGGATFARQSLFPGNDVRDVKAAAADSSLLYAVTGRNGAFKSQDGGQSWRSLGLEGTFFWSVAASRDGDEVYAASPEKQVLTSRDGGIDWIKSFAMEKAFALAIAPGAPGTLALATAAGLFLSDDNGAHWQREKGVPAGNFSSVLFSKTHPGLLWVGDWTAGVYRFNQATGQGRWLLKGVPVVHLVESDGRLLVGTWGQGLLAVDGAAPHPED